nr:hypothetical protein [uncultured Desulfobulbus sp.]
MQRKGDNKKRCWFPAKRYGYGWGLPKTWQGWLVLIIYLGLTTLGAWRVRGGGDLLWFVPLEAVLTGVFVWIVWKKGEPPAWRWGDDNSRTTSEK